MKRAGPMRSLRGIACAAALACAGCDPVTSAPPPCSTAIPPQAELLRAPGFEALTFHKRSAYEPLLGVGSDLWADARFEYRAAVEFTFVRPPGAAAGASFCGNAVSIKLALPMDERGKALLGGFVRAAAGRAGLDGAALQARIDEAAAQRARYRPIAAQGPVSVEAGALPHPKWGDMFVVAFASR